MKKCLICDSQIEPFINFGRMPIANGFLSPDQFASEYFFELTATYCAKCSMVQLAEQPDRERMFHENYAFFSSTSSRMAIHFKEFAELVKARHLKHSDPFVVEIGSNDGIMLQHFASSGIRHLGIEPSANVAKVAQGKGIETLVEFFDEDLARRIVSKHGQADAFLGANVMCHIPYLHSVASGIQLLLKPDGVLVFEDPYFGDILEKTSYDQIYDEHVFYFSVTSLSYLFEQHGMEIIDVQPQNVHGGSMRYILAHKGAHSVSRAVVDQRQKEINMGLDKSETYSRLRQNIEHSRDELLSLLKNINKQDKHVVGYAATSKSTTVINYCGITPDLVEYISDTTPIKQGRFSPGMHIPVRPYETFVSNYPEYALLFGWNHGEEIMAKEQAFRSSGGKWIEYVPKVGILS
ncbi:MAG: class I SAM-dependent methyltransferase [Anaerolineaceae bacterium]|nr:class I SAM-dependent methyltransferase [Anaerolineaceae bacterium]